MRRLNEEEVSRVLGALDTGCLGNPGDERSETMCIVQAADHTFSCAFSELSNDQRQLAKWYDSWRFGAANRTGPGGVPDVSATEFLRALEKAGIA